MDLVYGAILTVAHGQVDTENLYEMQEESFASGKE